MWENEVCMGLEELVPEEFLWKTKEGELIAIKDMSTSHIRNAIKLIVKIIGEQDIYYH